MWTTVALVIFYFASIATNTVHNKKGTEWLIMLGSCTVYVSDVLFKLLFASMFGVYSQHLKGLSIILNCSESRDLP